MVAQSKVSTDRIEKTVLLKATRERVWRAVSDAGEFGAWFGVRLEGSFKEGEVIRGKITYPGHEHLTMEVEIVRIEPSRYLSFRWHPYAIDPKVDYASEPTTLVELTIEDAPGGVRLDIVESGFDRIPIARRAEALRMNDGGWAEQTKNIERHVASA